MGLAWAQVETGKCRRNTGADADEHSRHGGVQTPSLPLPWGTWRLQYSNTMYTWSRSAKCPRKATMLRCRRRLCRAISRSTCRHSPPRTRPAHSSHANGHPPALKGRGLSGKPLWAWRPWALTGVPYLPTGAQTPSSSPTTRHHFDSEHAACRQVGQLVAAAEGALKGRDSQPQWTGVHKCVDRWPGGFTGTHLRHVNTQPAPSYLDTQCDAWEQTQGHDHSDRHIHTRHRKQRRVTHSDTHTHTDLETTRQGLEKGTDTHSTLGGSTPTLLDTELMDNT